MALHPDLADRLAAGPLACLFRQYPNQLSHVLLGDEDARPPRELTPVFFGCYDWHSAVHAHWTLARLLRCCPDASRAGEARAALAKSLRPERVERELEYLSRPGREGFERPYGLAWLTALFAELWPGRAEALRPLADEAARRLLDYFQKLFTAVRTGEHSQTAFSLSLFLDSSRVTGAKHTAAIEATIRRLYLADRDWPLHYEPGGTDFLSPGLCEADLVGRILPPREFAEWLSGFLPKIDLAPVTSPDPADGKFSHLDGLNLSRARMLSSIAEALPGEDARRTHLKSLAAAHAEAGLSAISGNHYAGAHWLSTFATLLLTRP